MQETRISEVPASAPIPQTASAGASNIIICSVCIAAYKRPDLLENLLTSLVNQVLPEDVTLEIIVVDNDPEESAREVVQKFSDTARARLQYCRQPIKNISLTRNLAVANATGTYLLFIDDDETACREWVARLLRALREFDADGVFGPVLPHFHDSTPEWLKQSQLFDDTCPAAATGTEAKDTWTGNCLVKASLLKGESPVSDDTFPAATGTEAKAPWTSHGLVEASLVEGIHGPFDPTYGLTGGEDAQLFDRLKRKGAKFIYCNEAWVSEYVPPSRTRVSYLVQRALRTGNARARLLIEAAGKGKVFIRLLILCKAICFGSISFVLAVVMFPSKIWRTCWGMKLATNVGRFLAVFGGHYQEYR